MSPPPWSPPALGRRGGFIWRQRWAARALLTREPAGTGVCPPASLASPAHPAQTCTSGGRAALRAVLPRRGSECLQAPGLTSLSRRSRPGSQHALGLGGRRGPPLATAHAPWGREGPAGAQEATEARPAPRSPQRHHVQQRGATGLPQGMQGLGSRGRLPPTCRLCPLDSPGLPSPSGSSVDRAGLEDPLWAWGGVAAWRGFPAGCTAPFGAPGAIMPRAACCHPA